MSKFVKPLASHLKTTLKLKFLMHNRPDNDAKLSDNLFVLEGIGMMTTEQGTTLGAVFRPKSMTYGAVTVIPASVMESNAEHGMADFGWLDTKSKIFTQALEQIAQEKALIAKGEKTFDQYPKLDDIFAAALSKQEGLSIHVGPFNYSRSPNTACSIYGEVSTPKKNPGNKPTL